MWTFSKRGFLTLIALIWIAILGVISPAWFSIGVVLVTGTSKGIDVSLGSKGNLYFCAGVVILVLGLVRFDSIELVPVHRHQSRPLHML